MVPSSDSRSSSTYTFDRRGNQLTSLSEYDYDGDGTICVVCLQAG